MQETLVHNARLAHLAWKHPLTSLSLCMSVRYNELVNVHCFHQPGAKTHKICTRKRCLAINLICSSTTMTCPALPLLILFLGVASTLTSVKTDPELGTQSLVSSERKELGDGSLVSSEKRLVSSEKRCLVDEPVPERKFLTHNSEKQVITLLGSHRIASRWMLKHSNRDLHL